MTKLDLQLKILDLEKLDFYEDEYVWFERREGFVYGVYKRGKIITLGIAKQIVQRRLEFCGYKDTLFIAAEDGIKGIKRDARQFLSSPEGVRGVKAGAMVSNSVLGTHLANFFIKISVVKKSVPIKLFNSVEAAEKWLEDYID